MKLVRYGERGAEKPGILDPEGGIRDLSAVVKDIAGDTVVSIVGALSNATVSKDEVDRALSGADK